MSLRRGTIWWKSAALRLLALQFLTSGFPPDRLEAARSTFGADNFFAKLGTRSGKDAVLCVVASALCYMMCSVHMLCGVCMMFGVCLTWVMVVV